MKSEMTVDEATHKKSCEVLKVAYTTTKCLIYQNIEITFLLFIINLQITSVILMILTVKSPYPTIIDNTQQNE